MRESKKRKLKKFLIYFILVSLVAAGLAVLASWYLDKYRGYSPSFYEPKDSEREKLIDERGRSITDK